MKKIIILLITAIVLFVYKVGIAQDVKGKLIVGYQGWFTCAGDNSPRNQWVHWGGNSPWPKPGDLHFDLYPDMREYTKTYQTGFDTLGNGQPATLFSSFDTQVVNKHVEWMQTYGIDVVALQRFASGVTPGSSHKAHKDSIATKIKNACETYGRKFYIMYDLSDMSVYKEYNPVNPENSVYDTTFIKTLRDDWNNTIKSSSALNLLASPAYAKEMVDSVSKPVVCIWGIGSKDRPGDQKSWTSAINWFKQQGCYVIVGAEKEWLNTPNVKAACENANMISPWHVGTFDNNSVSSWGSKISTDMNHCKTLGIDYMPVLWPGFSWRNWKEGYENKPNSTPRMHGNFMWEQLYNVKIKGIKNVYVAMFDEYDEGTAIAKAAENKSMIPTNQWFLTLDYDGIACSADFYLRLVGDGAKMMKGEIPTTNLHPTRHSDDTTLAVTGVTLSPDSVTLYKDSTKRLTATVLPEIAENKIVYWSSDNSTVASIYNGLVTAKKVGTATITARTLDGAKTATSFITVIAKTDSVPNAINDFKYNARKQSFNLYPNPLNQEILTIKLAGYEQSGYVEVIISDILGHKVYQKQVSNNKTLEINTSGILKNSIYFVSVKSKESINNMKLIVK
jgi:hypothetical protein